MMLMETAQQVTEERNYRKRIKHNRKDEVGTLLNAFNNMMQVIEDRDKQLLEHSENLEQIVEIRTEQINHRANFDSLTELPNRYLLLGQVKAIYPEYEKTMEAGWHCCIWIWIDLR